MAFQTIIRSVQSSCHCCLYMHFQLTRKGSTEAQRDIQQQALDDLSDAKLDVHLSFYLTSIYDHSIFEAFSKVIQELIPQLPILENLLNILNTVRGFLLVYHICARERE